MQRRRFGEAFGENVDWRRERNQFSWCLLERRSAGDSDSSAPPGPPNIGEKSVNRATKKSRDRVIAEDNILSAVHSSHTTPKTLFPVILLLLLL